MRLRRFEVKLYCKMLVITISLAAIILAALLFMLPKDHQIPSDHVYLIEHRVRMLGVQIQEVLLKNSKMAPRDAVDQVFAADPSLYLLCGKGIAADVQVAADSKRWTDMNKSDLLLTVQVKKQREVAGYIFYGDGSYKTILNNELWPAISEPKIGIMLTGK